MDEGAGTGIARRQRGIGHALAIEQQRGRFHQPCHLPPFGERHAGFAQKYALDGAHTAPASGCERVKRLAADQIGEDGVGNPERAPVDRHSERKGQPLRARQCG
jgi:hypothetical protein